MHGQLNLSDSKIEVKNEDYQRVKDYALKLLSFRPRSKKEITGRLMQYTVKKGVPPKEVDRVIDELIKQNLINDEEFASWWIAQRLSYSPKGRKIIELELRDKGVERGIIDKLFSSQNNFDENEFQSALKLVQKKRLFYKNYSEKEMRMKLENYLLRRGFTLETVKRVIDSILQKT